MGNIVIQGGETEREAATTRLSSKTAIHAQLRPRHRGLLLSILLFIITPVVATAAYMIFFAQPQYASLSGFVVRQDDSASASMLVGGLSQVLGSTGAGNSDLLYEFIQSEAIVRRIQEDINLIEHYSQTWPLDPFFSTPPDITMEAFVKFWRRMVRITHDKNSGVLMMEVRARNPVIAESISKMVISQSEAMINALNASARRNRIVNAQTDLDLAIDKLREAREALVAFQARTQILDPQADLQGRMGVLINLQQQLAQATVDYDLLLQTVDSNDLRLRQLSRRISVIEERILREREGFVAGDVTANNTDYPTLLAQYEGLRVDVIYAEEIYRTTLTVLTEARASAERQQLFVATFIEPSIPDVATHPRSILLIGITSFFAILFWSVGALVYYSLRDRG